MHDNRVSIGGRTRPLGGGGDRVRKWDDSGGSRGHSGNVREQGRNNLILLLPKRKSLSMLGLVFSPVWLRGGPDNSRG